MKPHVLLTNSIFAGTIEALEQEYILHKFYEIDDKAEFFNKHANDIQAIAGGVVPSSLIDALPNLQMIAGFGVGYDGIDIKAAKARGISVTNTPDVLNDAVAELAIGLMISLARDIPAAHAHVSSGSWGKNRFPLTTELNGKTLGIIGLGRIGKEIATRAQAMKMRIVYNGRNKQANVPYEYYADLVEMARNCDWLVAVTPGGAETHHIVSAQVLAALGERGHFVNIARGSVVDEGALLTALESKLIAGAALDVYENEPMPDARFLTLDNVVLTPHMASGTAQTRRAMGNLMLSNLSAHFSNSILISPVA